MDAQQMDTHTADVVFRHRIGDRTGLPAQVHPLRKHLFIMGIDFAKDIRLGQDAAEGNRQRLPDIDGIIHRHPQLLVRATFLAVFTID